MPDIFISYRRSDSQFETWQMYRLLSDLFGVDNVFLDVADIDKGDDFGVTQLAAVRSARVVLVVIGDRWLTATDSAGRRRLDNPDDNVLQEVRTALDRPDTTTIPVFLYPVTGLPKDDLPPSIRQLASRNGHAIRPLKDLDRDMD